MNTQLLDKLKKIHALAGNNPSEAEAQAAAAKLQALLFKHNLEMCDIKGHTIAGNEEKYEKADKDVDANAMTMKWKSTLYNGIALQNFCQVVRFSGTKRLAFIGKKSNIEAVWYLTEYLIKEIERISISQSSHILTKKARYRREFCYGATSRVLERLRAERDRAIQANAASTALVAVSTKELSLAIREYFPELSRRTVRVSTGGTGGYSAGHSAGGGINLGGNARQIGNGHSS